MVWRSLWDGVGCQTRGPLSKERSTSVSLASRVQSTGQGRSGCNGCVAWQHSSYIQGASLAPATVRGHMKRLLFGSIASGVIALAALRAELLPPTAVSAIYSDCYTHQIIRYHAPPQA